VSPTATEGTATLLAGTKLPTSESATVPTTTAVTLPSAPPFVGTIRSGTATAAAPDVTPCAARRCVQIPLVPQLSVPLVTCVCETVTGPVTKVAPPVCVTTAPLASVGRKATLAVSPLTTARIVGRVWIAVIVPVLVPPLPPAAVITIVPVTSSLVARIVAVPFPVGVTSPETLTVATSPLLELQRISRLRGVPTLSFATALSCTVCPGRSEVRLSAAVTVTVFTGIRRVSSAVPLFPSLVAVTVTAPVDFAVTSPAALTVARVSSLDAQVIVRFPRAFPSASLGTAESCSVFPITSLAVAGVTVIVATGAGITRSTADLLFPSLVAVIVVDPSARAVTSAFVETTPSVATEPISVSKTLQLTARSSAVPSAAFGVATSVPVFPKMTVSVSTESVTWLTGGSTVSAVPALFPSLVAVIVTAPAAFVVTRPPLPTTAFAVSLDVQVITRPVRSPPTESFVVAKSCTVCPATSVHAAGVTATLATGTGITRTFTLSRWSSAVATTHVTPSALFAVTRPAAVTVASVVSRELHVGVTVTPGSAVTDAASCAACVMITATESGVASTRCTPITGTAAVPVTPPALAEIVAVPRLTAVTCPEALTVATLASLEVHDTPTDGSATPPSPRSATPSCADCAKRNGVPPPDTATSFTTAGATTASPQEPKTSASSDAPPHRRSEEGTMRRNTDRRERVMAVIPS